MTHKKTRSILLIIFFSTLFSMKGQSQNSIRPINLTCEYLTNPIGLDALHPRFSWMLQATDSTHHGQKQTAYRISVASSENALRDNIPDIWDSGWIMSDKMQLIDYKGKELLSDRRYYWRVSVKDERDNLSQPSDIAQWYTGLLSSDAWTAQWIGSTQLFDYKKSAGNCNIDDPWFRKSFTLNDDVSRAMLFVASVGYHEVYVNGRKVGTHVLAPAVTDHTKRARYIAYDIANYLQKGKNVIGIWLGTSWAVFAPYFTPDKPRTPLAIAQTDMYGKNGQKLLRIQTDATWKTHASPNKLLGTWEMRNYGGEIWDANKEIKDWNTVECNDNTWALATVYHPRLKLSAQHVENNQLFNEIHPVAIDEKSDGDYRVDMGVNFAGWTQIRVKGHKGDTIRFLFSEKKNDDMTFNIHSAYVIGANGEGVFQNRFNYSSGRWITIKGLKQKLQPNDIKGWQVRTNYKPATVFASSDSLQNWIYDRIRWTFENLSIGGYVVDCPQRERFGYGGDAHATSETGMFNYRLGAFYTKWLQDWRDVQGTEPTVGNMNDPAWAHKQIGSGRFFGNGVLPHSAPTYHGGGGPAWGGIVVTLPWLIYRHEADLRVLEENFEMIKKWLDFLDSHTEDNLLQRFGGQWDFLGDWLWPHATEKGMNNDKPETLCLNNCYRVYNLRTAAKIARVLGKISDAEKWEHQARMSSQRIHETFYHAEDQSYADGSMGNLAAALYGNVMPEALRSVVMKRLEKEILVNRNGHIHVGITGGAMLFKVLRDAGRDDLIYSITSQTTYPSWGYMRENGATTIWEAWEKDLPGHSLLHSSYLYPGAWYVDGMAGIRRDEKVPGFKKYIVRVPKLSETQLSWAKADFDSPAGLIRSSWKREKRKISLTVTVPPNCEATIYFPDENGDSIKECSGFARRKGKKDGYILFDVPAGNYQFSN